MDGFTWKDASRFQSYFLRCGDDERVASDCSPQPFPLGPLYGYQQGLSPRQDMYGWMRGALIRPDDHRPSRLLTCDRGSGALEARGSPGSYRAPRTYVPLRRPRRPRRLTLPSEPVVRCGGPRRGAARGQPLSRRRHLPLPRQRPLLLAHWCASHGMVVTPLTRPARRLPLLAQDEGVPGAAERRD